MRLYRNLILSHFHQIKSDNDLTKPMMICEIIDDVDYHFCGYLSKLFV